MFVVRPVFLLALAAVPLATLACDANLTPEHESRLRRLQEANDCASLLSAEEVARVQAALSDNPVMLFAWAGCPCTNMARTRLSRSNVCFRKDIWWNADNALMHYLQCQHGSHHHSFAFFKGEFYGNGFYFDDNYLSDDRLHSMVDTAGAERTCLGGGIDRVKALQLCMLPDVPETQHCFAEAASTGLTSNQFQTCCEYTAEELAAVEGDEAATIADAVAVKNTFCESFYNGTGPAESMPRLREFATQYCDCGESANETIVESSQCRRDENGNIIFNPNGAALASSFLWCTSTGSNMCAAHRRDGAHVVFSREPLEDEKVDRCEFCSSSCKAKHGIWSHYTPGHNGACGTGFSAECENQCCETKFGWHMDEFCDHEATDDADRYASGDKGENAAAGPETLDWHLSSPDPVDVAWTISGDLRVDGITEEDWDADSTLAEALMSVLAFQLDVASYCVQIVHAYNESSDRRRLSESTLVVQYQVLLDDQKDPDVVTRRIQALGSSTELTQGFKERAEELNAASVLVGLTIEVVVGTTVTSSGAVGGSATSQGDSPFGHHKPSPKQGTLLYSDNGESPNEVATVSGQERLVTGVSVLAVIGIAVAAGTCAGVAYHLSRLSRGAEVRQAASPGDSNSGPTASVSSADQITP